MRLTTFFLAVLAITIAATAAYFSIYGLALVFSGAIIAVAVMASALEVGKLALTSVVFHYWRQFHPLATLYYVLAIIGLMIITSWGIYGFLSAAYQKSLIPLQQVEIKTNQLQDRLVLLDQEYDRRIERLAQMDTIISSIGANYITRRMEEMEKQAPERDDLIERTKQIEQEKIELLQDSADLQNQTIEIESHIGPIVNIARQFGIEKDQAIHYLILLFIFVFDPLAIGLTIAVNTIIKIDKQSKRLDGDHDVHVVPVVPQPTEPSDSVIDQQQEDPSMTINGGNTVPSSLDDVDITFVDPPLPPSDNYIDKTSEALLNEIAALKKQFRPAKPDSRDTIRRSITNQKS